MLSVFKEIQYSTCRTLPCLRLMFYATVLKNNVRLYCSKMTFMFFFVFCVVFPLLKLFFFKSNILKINSFSKMIPVENDHVQFFKKILFEGSKKRNQAKGPKITFTYMQCTISWTVLLIFSRKLSSFEVRMIVFRSYDNPA